jgi:ribosome biogenesis GTP-binding protein YlqF
MNKARKQVKEIMPRVDVVIEVLDARLPYSSTNPMIEQLRGTKPYLKVLSKSDLADEAITQAWQAFFRQQRNMDAIAISTRNTNLTKTIPDRVFKLAPFRGNKNKPVTGLILGIPNVGKSTLINTLAGRRIAKVGDEPAITKGQQRIKISEEFILIDSPGMTWPGSKNEMINYRLATSGAIRDTVVEYDHLAMFAMDYVLQRYPDRVSERYQIDDLVDSAYDALEQVAKKRGCMKRGGVDLLRVGELFIRELRSGKLGRISFEEPHLSYIFRD